MKSDLGQGSVCVWKQEKKINVNKMLRILYTVNSEKDSTISNLSAEEKCRCLSQRQITVWQPVPLRNCFQAMCADVLYTSPHRYNGGIP